MRDRRLHAVQVLQATQDLACHALDCLQVQVLVQVAVLAQIARGEELRDEVDAAVVCPALVALDDVGMLQFQALLDVRHHGAQLFLAEVQEARVRADLAPGHVDALQRVEGLPHLLEPAPPHGLAVPVVAALWVLLHHLEGKRG
eukprot:1157658-Pelagomonas_calceolata.AAC.3